LLQPESKKDRERETIMTCSNYRNAADKGSARANPVFPHSILRVQMPEEAWTYPESADISHPPPSEPFAIGSSFGDFQYTLQLLDCAIAIVEDVQLHPHNDDITVDMVRLQ
jgi:hypothetical protein